MSLRPPQLSYLMFLLTVFISAFLLFQVQPLISRFILPWFGGTPAVWTTCVLFFQVMLFGGYLYAHLLVARLKPVGQIVLHASLLLAAAMMLPIIPDADLRPESVDTPVMRIVFLLTVTVGLPYFVLSATGPLAQGWFHQAMQGRSPYRLYALSNAGSLLALLTYPFVFEPRLATDSQAAFWSWAFVGFAVCCIVCGVVMLRTAGRQPAESGNEAAADSSVPTPGGDVSCGGRRRPAGTSQVALWAVFAAVPSVMLLATTGQVCTDIAVVPFLWVLPLSLYLLSFILCFDSERWYSRKVFGTLLGLSVAASVFLLLDSAHYWNLVLSITMQAGIYFSLLFCCCMVCHGELYRLKPQPQQLTLYYLSIAAGGAVGGLFAGIAAPVLFDTLLELHCAIVGSVLLLAVAMYRDAQSPMFRGRRPGAWAAVALSIGGLVWALHLQVERVTRNSLAVRRNFYGVLRVDRFADSFVMKHGQIRHGQQFVDAVRRQLPTTYYGHESGVGIVLRQHCSDRPGRVGVIGLGAGTLTAYGQSDDYYRLYEINPAVVDMAREFFTYMADSPAAQEVVIADGRIALEREEPQRFDVLVLDAFSGDAVPAHLLTRECGGLYLKHLAEDGILAIHITNRHLDLRPVCQGLADEFQLSLRTIFSAGDAETGTTPATWVLMSRRAGSLAALDAGPSFDIARSDRSVLWTDQWSNLLSVISADPAAGFELQAADRQRKTSLVATVP